MVHTSLKNRLNALEESKKVKRELPWDCKELFSQYQRGDIINTLTGCKGSYRLVVDDMRCLSLEALEFLSLSGAGQARAVEQCTQVISEVEAEELRRDILERLSCKISVDGRGCLSLPRCKSVKCLFAKTNTFTY